MKNHLLALTVVTLTACDPGMMARYTVHASFDNSETANLAVHSSSEAKLRSLVSNIAQKYSISRCDTNSAFNHEALLECFEAYRPESSSGKHLFIRLEKVKSSEIAYGITVTQYFCVGCEPGGAISRELEQDLIREFGKGNITIGWNSSSQSDESLA